MGNRMLDCITKGRAESGFIILLYCRRYFGG